MKNLSSLTFVWFVLSFAIAAAIWLSSAGTAIPDTAEFSGADFSAISMSGSARNERTSDSAVQMKVTHRVGA